LIKLHQLKKIKNIQLEPKEKRYKKKIPSFDNETPLKSANTQMGAKK
jgi:hypothetical protein